MIEADLVTARAAWPDLALPLDDRPPPATGREPCGDAEVAAYLAGLPDFVAADGTALPVARAWADTPMLRTLIRDSLNRAWRDRTAAPVPARTPLAVIARGGH